MEWKLENLSFLQLLQHPVQCPCREGRGGTETALGLCRFRGEEWSMCVLSMVIKEKEIFHWVLGEGFHSASVLW